MNFEWCVPQHQQFSSAFLFCYLLRTGQANTFMSFFCRERKKSRQKMFFDTQKINIHTYAPSVCSYFHNFTPNQEKMRALCVCICISSYSFFPHQMKERKAGGHGGRAVNRAKQIALASPKLRDLIFLFFVFIFRFWWKGTLTWLYSRVVCVCVFFLKMYTGKNVFAWFIFLFISFTFFVRQTKKTVDKNF